MARVAWTRNALRDLDAVTRYIAAENPDTASDLFAKLLVTGDSLAHFPSRGRPAGNGRRELVTLAPHIIVYRVTGSGVVIEHIRHSARAG